MKNGWVLLALVLAGCGPGPEGAPPPADRPDEVLMPDVQGGGEGNLRYTLDERGMTHNLEVSPESAWPHLVDAYASLDIVPDVVDDRSFRIAVADLTITRRLAGERLSRVFSCGMTMTGPVADGARITLQLRSQLLEAPQGRSTLQTRLQGVAVPNDAAAGGTRPCTSRHWLELRIAEAVLDGLGMP